MKENIITNADKDGAVIVTDVEKSDKKNTLQEDPTWQQRKLFNDRIDRFKKSNLLSKKLADGLESVKSKKKVLLCTQNT